MFLALTALLAGVRVMERTLAAKVRVQRVSSALSSSGQAVTIMSVRALPPRQSCTQRDGPDCQGEEWEF